MARRSRSGRWSASRVTSAANWVIRLVRTVSAIGTAIIVVVIVITSLLPGPDGISCVDNGSAEAHCPRRNREQWPIDRD